MAETYGSVTPSVAAVATAASTALPPWRSTSTPALLASRSTLETAPPYPTATASFRSWGGCTEGWRAWAGTTRVASAATVSPPTAVLRRIASPDRPGLHRERVPQLCHPGGRRSTRSRRYPIVTV